MGDYGFVGRGREIHLMEQFRKTTNPVILIYGSEGVGKTELVWGFLNWLRMTGNLSKIDNDTEPVFWTKFQDVSNAGDILNPLYKR